MKPLLTRPNQIHELSLKFTGISQETMPSKPSSNLQETRVNNTLQMNLNNYLHTNSSPPAYACLCSKHLLLPVMYRNLPQFPRPATSMCIHWHLKWKNQKLHMKYSCHGPHGILLPDWVMNTYKSYGFHFNTYYPRSDKTSATGYNHHSLWESHHLLKVV